MWNTPTGVGTLIETVGKRGGTPLPRLWGILDNVFSLTFLLKKILLQSPQQIPNKQDDQLVFYFSTWFKRRPQANAVYVCVIIDLYHDADILNF